MKAKKAQNNIGLIVPLVIGIGMAVMVLIVVGSLSGVVFNEQQDDIAAIGVYAVSKEAFTSLNYTTVQLDHTLILTGTMIVQNGSATIGNGNFTIDYDAGTIQGVGTKYNNTPLNASYSWHNATISSHITNGILGAFQGLENTGTYMPIFVMAIVIVIILSMVLSFGNINRGGGGSAL